MSYYSFKEKNSYKLSLGAMDYVLLLIKGHYTLAFEEKLILRNYNKENLK